MPRPRTDFKKEQFYFWRYDPGSGQMPEQDWRLNFEAHITNISDSSNPSYNEFYDMGRADPKLFYSGVNRQINLSFFLIGFNEKEHKDNHDIYLARLGRLTYPIYESNRGYSSPHVLLTIGNLFQGYGVITSLTYDWKPESPWIDHRPLYTDISLTFRVLANSQGYRPDAGKQAQGNKYRYLI